MSRHLSLAGSEPDSFCSCWPAYRVSRGAGRECSLWASNGAGPQPYHGTPGAEARVREMEDRQWECRTEVQLPGGACVSAHARLLCVSEPFHFSSVGSPADEASYATKGGAHGPSRSVPGLVVLEIQHKSSSLLVATLEVFERHHELPYLPVTSSRRSCLRQVGPTARDFAHHRHVAWEEDPEEEAEQLVRGREGLEQKCPHVAPKFRTNKCC